MTIQAFMTFQTYNPSGAFVVTQPPASASGPSITSADGKTTYPYNNYILLDDSSFDIEQTLNIGSQSSGAGAGKITFNPLSITKKIDVLSSILFQNCASGTPFQFVQLLTLASPTTANKNSLGQAFLQFTFKLVAVKTVAYTHTADEAREVVTFEYGGLQIRYAEQSATGTLSKIDVAGWNRVKNISDTGTDPIT